MIARCLLVLAVGAFAFAGVFALVHASFPPWLGLLVLIGAAYACRRKVTPWVHGSSRWANAKDLAPLMTADRGLILGRSFARPSFWQGLDGLFTLAANQSRAACNLFFASLKSKSAPGQLVRLPNAVHTALFAPTGIGKSTGFIIPHLLTCRDSAVVFDPKGEIARETAWHRHKKFGHRCVFLDPFHEFTTKSDALNPIDFIDRRDPDLIDTCRGLAESMIIRTGMERDPTWNDNAENFIRSICCYVAHFAPDDDRSLQTVRDIIADTQTVETHAKSGLFHGAVEALQKSEAFDGIFSRMGNQLRHYRDKELASTLTTCNRFLSFLDSPAVQICTDRSTFDPSELKLGKMTVYLVLPPLHLRAQSALLRMWITALMHAVVKEG